MSESIEISRIMRSVVPTMIKLSNQETNIDPNGMLLNKQSQGIFNVNTEDFNSLAEHLGSKGAATQYVEMITQRPFISTVKSVGRNSIILDDVIYFNNSWDNWSWGKIMDLVRKDKYSETPAVYWTKYQYKDDPYSTAYEYLKTELRNKRLVNKNKQVIIVNMSLQEVVDDAIEFIKNTPGVKHIWIQGHIQERGRKYGPFDIIQKITGKLKEVDKHYTMNEQTHQRVYSRYWKGMDLIPISMKYIEIKPQPCVPFRVNEFNFLEDREQNCVQMYPCTNFRSILDTKNLQLFDAYLGDMFKIMANTSFLNYSEYVTVMPINDDMLIKTYDFLYKKDERHDWVYVVCSIEDTSQKYVVTDEFMMGSASVITSRHRSFGLCRDVDSLIRQQSYTGRISGHMIAAQLAYTTHLLWYLYEVYYNYSTKKSTYKLTVIEPTEDRYHNRVEYENAIKEVREAYYNARSSSQSQMLFRINIKISEIIISLLA